MITAIGPNDTGKMLPRTVHQRFPHCLRPLFDCLSPYCAVYCAIHTSHTNSCSLNYKITQSKMPELFCFKKHHNRDIRPVSYFCNPIMMLSRSSFTYQMAIKRLDPISWARIPTAQPLPVTSSLAKSWIFAYSKNRPPRTNSLCATTDFVIFIIVYNYRPTRVSNPVPTESSVILDLH